MLYIENIFVCLVAPIVVLLFFVSGTRKQSIVAVICGMVACLLSAYVSAFFAQVYGADAIGTATEISPVIEEMMKFLPVVFFLAVFEPNDENLTNFALLVGISFATLENICYLIENGASSMSMLMLRGFGTGAMHLACVMLAVYGLVMFRRTKARMATRAVGAFAVLCVSISFHEMYNVLIAAGAPAMYLAFATPIVTCAAIFIRTRLQARKLAAQQDALQQTMR